MSDPRGEILESRRGRIVFIHIPICASSLTVTFLFAFAVRNLSGHQVILEAMTLGLFWSVFVIIPLLILVTPVKRR